MKNISFPIQLAFRVTSFANDFIAKDANDRTIAFVRQKILRLIDEVNVYNDESKSVLLYTIKANKWIDFSATYTFTSAAGKELGRVARKGWASIWKAHYEIYDEHQAKDLIIQEENGWIKVMDSLLSEIPMLGMFTGYLFNPSYSVTRPDGTMVARLKKEPSLLGRRFSVNKLTEFEQGEEERIVLSLMMMILLERRRG